MTATELNSTCRLEAAARVPISEGRKTAQDLEFC